MFAGIYINSEPPLQAEIERYLRYTHGSDDMADLSHRYTRAKTTLTQLTLSASLVC